MSYLGTRLGSIREGSIQCSCLLCKFRTRCLVVILWWLFYSVEGKISRQIFLVQLESSQVAPLLSYVIPNSIQENVPFGFYGLRYKYVTAVEPHFYVPLGEVRHR